MRIIAAGSFLAFFVAASPVLAHHISGTVYCDEDSDGVIDIPGDTPIVGVVAVATSLDVAPGTPFSDGTDATGLYYIPLPARTDRYTVELVGLPGSFNVVVPPGGTYTIQIITASANDHKDDVNFLVQGCAVPPTTTTTSTTTTTAPSTSSTVTTTTTSTTTTLFFCNCPATPFLVARDAKVGNDGTIAGNIGSNNLGGRVRLGKGVTMPDGTRINADTVSLGGGGTSVFQVLGNTLLINPAAVVRGGTGLPVLPIANPFCALPAIPCGTNDVQVPPNQTMGPLAPGTYGRLKIMNGATLTLSPGTFTFCSIKTGRNAIITTLGPATLNVSTTVVIGTAARLAPASGMEPVRVNVAGKAVRVSQSGVANAAFIAPSGRISFGRDALLLGCYCTDRSKSDKHITLVCPVP